MRKKDAAFAVSFFLFQNKSKKTAEIPQKSPNYLLTSKNIYDNMENALLW